jgi:low affinity Fe/Cu permease
MTHFKNSIVYLTAVAIVFIFTTFATQAYVREYVTLKMDTLCTKVDYIVKTVDEIKSDLRTMKRSK